jgi:hypothetical protein
VLLIGDASTIYLHFIADTKPHQKRILLSRRFLWLWHCGMLEGGLPFEYDVLEGPMDRWIRLWWYDDSSSFIPTRSNGFINVWILKGAWDFKFSEFNGLRFHCIQEVWRFEFVNVSMVSDVYDSIVFHKKWLDGHPSTCTCSLRPSKLRMSHRSKDSLQVCCLPFICCHMLLGVMPALYNRRRQLDKE